VSSRRTTSAVGRSGSCLEVRRGLADALTLARPLFPRRTNASDLLYHLPQRAGTVQRGLSGFKRQGPGQHREGHLSVVRGPRRVLDPPRVSCPGHQPDVALHPVPRLCPSVRDDTFWLLLRGIRDENDDEEQSRYRAGIVLAHFAHSFVPSCIRMKNLPISHASLSPCTAIKSVFSPALQCREASSSVRGRTIQRPVRIALRCLFGYA
jgi:hypothetical protein